MQHIFSWPTDCRQTDRSHYWIYVEQPMIIPSQMPQMKENDVHGVMIRLTASFLRELVHSLSHFANKLGPVVLDNWGVLFWSYSPFIHNCFVCIFATDMTLLEPFSTVSVCLLFHGIIFEITGFPRCLSVCYHGFPCFCPWFSRVFVHGFPVSFRCGSARMALPCCRCRRRKMVRRRGRCTLRAAPLGSCKMWGVP